MLRFAKLCGWLLLLALTVPSAPGFSLVGPPASWQTSGLGYSKLAEINFPAGGWFNLSPDWTYAPKNINEGYRWPFPVLFYTYDASFSTYFGAAGIRAVDGAFDILNGVGNVDGYSDDLSEVAPDEARQNHTAAALRLFDLKSAALEAMMPRLGLADPERWTWCLRDRILWPGASCPYYDFSVIQRNFDPVTWDPTKYVNGNLFTYHWLQFCAVMDDRSDPVEYRIDPLSDYLTAVATPKITHPVISYYGMFHTALTRDDVGGLRRLYSTNSLAVEQAPSNTYYFNTNYQSTIILSTSNLTELAFHALTNDQATLQALYPNLQILTSSNWFANVRATNVTAYFTNFPYDPVGTPPRLFFLTNILAWVEPRYSYTYGNLLIPTRNGGQWALTPAQELPRPGQAWVSIDTTVVAVSNKPYAPVGALTITTNSYRTTFLTNWVVGDYVLLPTNVCAAEILKLQLTTVTTATNVLTSATNELADVGGGGGTPGGGGDQGTTNLVAGTVLEFSQNLVTYSTNRFFVARPVTCDSGSTALRRGVQKLTFVRKDFDSLIGRYFYPITNFYTMTAVTNSQPITQKFMRIVTEPDILITAANLSQNLVPVDVIDHHSGAPNFNTSNTVDRADGPGTLEGPVRITFNNVGPIRLNSGPAFVDEATSIFYFAWASFDGSTNAPVVYCGPTLRDLEKQVLRTVAPAWIPVARYQQAYQAELAMIGGSGPYNWGITPGSALPSWLSLTQNPADSSKAKLAGTPPEAGQYQFILRVTEPSGEFTDASYVVTVNP